MSSKTLARVVALLFLLGSLFVLQLLYQQMSRLQQVKTGKHRETRTKVIFRAGPDMEEILRARALEEKRREDARARAEARREAARRAAEAALKNGSPPEPTGSVPEDGAAGSDEGKAEAEDRSDEGGAEPGRTAKDAVANPSV